MIFPLQTASASVHYSSDSWTPAPHGEKSGPYPIVVRRLQGNAEHDYRADPAASEIFTLINHVGRSGRLP